MNGCESVGWIHDLPIAAGDFVSQRPYRVAEHPQARHRQDMLEIEEPVAFAVVSDAGDDGAREAVDHRGIHLPVAVDLDDDVRAVGKRFAVPSHHRATDALVLRVAKHAHARIRALLLDQIATLLGTEVVDGIDALDFEPDASDDL